MRLTEFLSLWVKRTFDSKIFLQAANPLLGKREKNCISMKSYALIKPRVPSCFHNKTRSSRKKRTFQGRRKTNHENWFIKISSGFIRRLSDIHFLPFAVYSSLLIRFNSARHFNWWALEGILQHPSAVNLSRRGLLECFLFITWNNRLNQVKISTDSIFRLSVYDFFQWKMNYYSIPSVW